MRMAVAVFVSALVIVVSIAPCLGTVITADTATAALTSRVWPMPATVSSTTPAASLTIDPTAFTIDTTKAGGPSGFVGQAAQRYLAHRIFELPTQRGTTHDNSRRHTVNHASTTQPTASLTQLSVIVTDATNTSLSMGVDESYTLSVTSGASPTAILTAPTVWGALRGLETFAQSVLRTTMATGTAYHITAVDMNDHPRFPFRGILVDTARHYINMTRLLDIVDAMEILKLNVMLLHLTDDQSFPFGSTTHPNITTYGAFSPEDVYSHADVAALSAYAKARGVRIQVELDLPAHAASWRGQYDFAWCATTPNTPGKPSPGGGLPNPALPSTFSTLSDLYGELAPLLNTGTAPSVHLGGDEVERNCWTDDSTVAAWAAAHGYRNDLQAWDCGNRTVCSTECAFHVGQARAALAAGFGSLFMWEDARGCEALLDVDPNSIVDVWDQGAEGQWQGGLADTLRRGWHAVVSSGCYFLEFAPPWASTWSWQNNYACDVQNVSVPNDQLAMIVGGHASRWGESTTGDNWFDHVFPSLCGVAEKLWSPMNATTPATAVVLTARTPAVQQVLCRMKWLGLGPMNVGAFNPLNGTYVPWPPGFCDG
eukprot:m.14497 g.14497  ORF g.14497 m.14497 type:complete len:597 (+) comp3158_c0_seq1:123-1913(+)